MKWFLSVALSFVLAFMSVPALALESDDAENVPTDAPSEETVPDGISDTAAPPTSETVPSAVEVVSEVAPEVAETASSATGATVVDRELGDFTVHAEAWYQDEQGQIANDEDRLARTLSFVADDGSQGGPGTLVIGADADAVTGEESYTISLKEGVASTSDSIEVRTRAFGSAYADDVYVVLDRVAINTTGRQASPLRIAESAGKVNLSLNGSNTLEGAHGFAGIQKDNGVDATLSLHGESDTALKSKGGFGSAGIGGGFAQGEDSLVGGIVLSGYGTIEAEGGDGAAGIGSGSSKDEGQSHATDITVESGTVRATGGLFGAGIGSGSSEEGGSHADGVTIAGGNVAATGGADAPGIGSGCSQKAESVADGIRVEGGTVVAQGGETAAGIGSGWGYGYSSATNFTVSYGSVQATGGAGAPGIGSGYCHVSDSVAANIVLSGGDVIAQGGDSKRAEIGGQEQVIGAGAGIGSGWSEEADSFCNAVALSGARVTAKAGADTVAAGGAAGIGSGSALAGTSRMENFVLSAGTLEAMGSATTLAGSQPQTLPAIGPGMAQARAMAGNSLAPAEGLCANAWKGATAEAAEAATPVLTARVEPFAIDETSMGDTYVHVLVVPQAKLTVTGGAYDTDADGTVVLTESATYTISTSGGVSNNGIRVAAGVAPSVVLDSASIDTSAYEGRAAFLVPVDAGATTLVLKGDNTLTSGRNCAGIQKESDVDAELVITSASGDGSMDGTLVAAGGWGGAGIGSGYVRDGKSETAGIRVAGGTITATGGAQAAGLGSGFSFAGDSAARNIAIEGGSITAEGTGKNAAQAAGIGSGVGMNSQANGITITGGTVRASGGRNGLAAGIGSGRASGEQGVSTAMGIIVSGGEVTALASNGAAGIGSGTGYQSLAGGFSITGGTITATGREGAHINVVGIGSGSGTSLSQLEDVLLQGGTVCATGVGGGSGIGSGYVEQGGLTSSDSIEISGGAVEAQGGAGGLFSEQCSYTAPAFGPSEVADGGDNPATTFSEGVQLDAADAKWYTNIWTGESKDDAEWFAQDKRRYPYQLTARDTYVKVTVSPEAAPRLAITTADGQPVPASEYDYDLTKMSATLVIKGSGTYRIALADGVSMSTHGIAVAAGASPTVLLDNVTIATELAGAPFSCLKGAGNVTVQLKGKNYLEAGSLGKCGLVAPSDGTLTIEGVEAGASLEAIGAVLNAGIGASGASGASGGDSACSSIVIQNAKVTARGGMMAAGIGSGYAGSAFSTVSDIVIRNSTIVAEGGTTAAGIGSGYGKLGSAASRITVENSDVTATGGAGAPGIGSGYADTGDSVASDIVIAGGTVAATGGDSLRGGSGATEESVIGGGAGIGSGWAEAGSTTARNIVVSGGTVTATGGADTEGIGSGAGIGSGSALVGASSAAGIRITGGTVVATGGTTTRTSAGPEALPGVGAGSGTSRSAEDNAIVPAEGLWANAWKGASAEAAVQFVANVTQTSDLAGVEDAYMKVALTPAGEQGGADDGTQGGAATKPLVGGSDATVLAATGDNASLPGAVLALALGALVALVLATGAARFPRRGKNAGRSLR